MMGLKETFTSIIQRSNNVKIAREELAPADPDKQLAMDLFDWANMDAAQETFLPWLDTQIAQQQMQRRMALEKPGLATFYDGRQSFAEELKAKFEAWSGQGREAPRTEK